MNEKAFKKIISMCLTIVAIISLVGCNSQATDSGFINSDKYEDTKYWKTERLDIVTNVSMKYAKLDDNIESNNFSEMSKKQKSKVEKLKKAIYNYFIKKNNINFSEKLDKQKVTFFSAPSLANSMTMGYVDINDPNTLHLNTMLNSEYQDLFESTYVHETLHQLGFQDESCEATYIVEGIVDAYTDLILKSNNITSQPTDLYFEARQLGYQMIAADTNLPNEFINKKSIKDYINNSLSSYTQECTRHKDLSGYLNTLLNVLISINSGTSYSTNTYYYVFDAQSIVQKYCQAQDCDEPTIEYIRNHYLLDDFENLKVITNNDGSYTIR